MLAMIVSILISLPAAADEVGVADCSSGEFRLELARLDRTTNARITEADNAETLEFPKVKKDKASKSPLIFTGKDFKLVVQNKSPIKGEDEDAEPHFPAHLSATAEGGRKIEKDLNCSVY